MKKIIAAAVLGIFFASCNKYEPMDYPPLPPQPLKAVVIVKSDPTYGNQTISGTKVSYLVGAWAIEVKNEAVQFIGTTFTLDTLSGTSLAKVSKLSTTIKGIGVDLKSDTLKTLQTRENDFYLPHSMYTVLAVNDSYRIKLYADVVPPVKFTTRMKFWFVNGRGELLAVEYTTGQTITSN